MAERPLFDPARLRRPSEAGASPTIPSTVTPYQVNELVRGAIARHIPSTLHVLAEIGDISRPASGHVYLTLKDAQAELRAVMWRSSAGKLRFEPKTGMEVIATGGLELYAARGSYQLIVRQLEPRGVGALELAFRQLREKLQREGLFDASRKQPIPRIPQRVALVTSPSGAAFHDVVRVFQRRCAGVEIVLAPVRVQGEGAADEIAAAIDRINAAAESLGGVDVILVARGGGSLEDLWAFNEEVVARAIAASRLPVVSGVGHEVDVTICDLAADLRAATPTAAAELLTPDAEELRLRLAQAAARTMRAARTTAELARRHVDQLGLRDVLARPTVRLRERAQRIDELALRLATSIRRRLTRAREELQRSHAGLAQVAAGAGMARLSRRLENRTGHLLRSLDRAVLAAHRRLHSRALRLREALPAGSLARHAEHLRQHQRRMTLAAERMLEQAAGRLNTLAAAIAERDPRRILARGYSVTRDARTGRVIRSVAQVADGGRIITQVSDGEFRSTADDPRRPGLFE